MKKYFLSLLLLVCVSAVSFAQTKRIAMRSHSGRGNAAQEKNDNWGGPPPDYKAKKKEEDSIRKAWAYRNKQDSILNAKTKKDSLAKISPRKKIKKYKKSV